LGLGPARITDHGNKSGLTLAFAIALEELSKKKQTTEVGQADDHGDKRHLEIYWVEGCQEVHGGYTLAFLGALPNREGVEFFLLHQLTQPHARHANVRERDRRQESWKREVSSIGNSSDIHGQSPLQFKGKIRRAAESIAQS
jgi:hypothetical protein